MKNLLLCLTAICSATAGSNVSLAADTDNRPNIVFILTDDQRWNALGCMGDPNVKTPNIDKLAAEGVLFRNHFVTTSICCISRASILTGQYERRHGVGDFGTPLKDSQWKETYPAVMKDHGYYTGFIGKFGVGTEKQVVTMADKFDFWRGIPGQGGKYFIEPGDDKRVHQTARYGEQALEFLGSRPAGKPFCLSVSFTAPHARDHMPREFTPDDRDESLYTKDTIAAPEIANDTYFQKLPESVKTSISRERWQWRFDTPEKFQTNTKDYYRLISGIDREVGRIIEDLKARNLADNTVIIFTSDNGYALGDRGLAGKWYMYEESLRDPLIILDPRGPASKRGRSEDAMTLNIDFAPTMLALAGIEQPAVMQGRSLVPLVENKKPADWRTEFFYEHDFSPKQIPASEGVRTERWAYIRWVNEKPVIEELFDLKNDPLEGHNLAADPEHREILEQMRARRSSYVISLK